MIFFLGGIRTRRQGTGERCTDRNDDSYGRVGVLLLLLLLLLLSFDSDTGRLVTPSGLTSIPAGLETPEMIQLRKKKIEEAMDQGYDDYYGRHYPTFTTDNFFCSSL